MLKRIGPKFEEWLLPRSRMMLFGLLAANIGLGLWLHANSEQLPVEAPKLAGFDDNIALIAEVPHVPAAPKPPPRECRQWGPESDPEAFADLFARLDRTGGFPEVKPTQVQGAPDYLVYIGELASADRAKRVVKELSALSIDSYRINREDGTPIVSVGVFSRQSLAAEQERRVSGLGYGVFVEELPRAQTVYNLAAHVSVDSELYRSSVSSCLAFAQNS